MVIPSIFLLFVGGGQGGVGVLRVSAGFACRRRVAAFSRRVCVLPSVTFLMVVFFLAGLLLLCRGRGSLLGPGHFAFTLFTSAQCVCVFFFFAGVG